MKKKLAVTIALGLGISYCTIAPSHTYARETLETKISQVNSEAASQQSEKDQVLAQEKQLQGELNKLRDQVMNMTGNIGDKQVEIGKNKEEMSKVKKDIADTKKDMEKRKDYLKARAKSYYVNGDTNFLDVILGSKNIGDFIERSFAVKEIATNDQKIINEQKADKVKLEKGKSKLQKDLDASQEQMDDLQKMLDEIGNMQEKKQAAAEILNSKASSIDERLADLKNARTSLTKEKASEQQQAIEAQKATQQASVVATQKPEVKEIVSHSNASSNKNNEAASKATTSSKESHEAGAPKPQPESQSVTLDESVSTGGVSGIINAGRKYIGNSTYVWGGGRNASDVVNGRFDCSGFIYWAFRSNGVKLGGQSYGSTSTLQYVGKKVSPSDMKPGDLVFFNTDGRTNGHVGIYMGGGQWIGSQSSHGVAIESMSNPYWSKHFAGNVRRVLGN